MLNWRALRFQVWIWPGSLFGSERWIDVLLQQSEAANRTCGRLTRDELLAVIEGSFFLRPHHQSMLIDNGHFQSYQVIFTYSHELVIASILRGARCVIDGLLGICQLSVLFNYGIGK